MVPRGQKHILITMAVFTGANGCLALTSRASRTVCSVAHFVQAATLAQNATPQTAAALGVRRK